MRMRLGSNRAYAGIAIRPGNQRIHLAIDARWEEAQVPGLAAHFTIYCLS